ncbi:Nucleoside diphosphate-linked moiety X motif 19-like protein, partial [Dinothrombium tinctorium]
FVFPGGHVDRCDFSSYWWKVFENHGVSREELRTFSAHITGPRPPIITDSLTAHEAGNSDDLLPPDIGLRITAIRETFEETGVLLVGLPSAKLDLKTSEVKNLNEWRLRVQSDAKYFADLCLEIGVCPDIWSLFEWWNWLTPESLGHKRFDTIFYICCLDEIPQTQIDGKEVCLIEWTRPQKMLEEHIQKRAFLAPPQIYELSRLLNFNEYKNLRDFALKREKLGIQRWSPSMLGFKDGILLAFPGDDEYGKQQDSEAIKSMPILEENRLKSVNLNRLELHAPVGIIYCNVKVTCGHFSPQTYPPIGSVIQSRL